MSFESALYTHLTGLSGITAVVSTRIYQEIAPTDVEKPYITWSIISDVPTGHIYIESGIAKKVVQFDVFAETDLTVNSAEDALRNGIDGFSGTMGSGSHTIVVHSIRKKNSFQRMIPPSDGSQRAIYRRMAEYSFWHREVVPTLA